MPQRKKSAGGGADVFEAYEAAHRRGKGKKRAPAKAGGKRATASRARKKKKKTS